LLAARLKGVRLDSVYSSRLRRSYETALMIRGGVPVRPLAGLDERRLGAFEGQRRDAEYERRSQLPDDTLDGGESLTQFATRIRATLDGILARHRSGAILIVGHGGTNQGIVGALFHLSAQQAAAFQQANDDLYLCESKATVPGRPDTPALLRQAPNNWNADATYDRGPFSARIGVTHHDANIYSYNFRPGADGGLTGPNGDLYLYAHTQVDAQASYAVNRKVQFVLALLNLNNEVFGFYQGSPQYPVQREFYNRTVSFGIRLTR
jgi:broad specificity phosphatase PhoE